MKTKSVKTDLSPIAVTMLICYKDATDGHENFLTDHLKRCELSNAMRYCMMVDNSKSKPFSVGEYLAAFNELEDMLGL